MKKYDKEFKKEAVKKYLDGQSVASISREIGVNENTIHTAVGRRRFCRSMEKLIRRNS
jgi:transposase-like protein